MQARNGTKRALATYATQGSPSSPNGLRTPPSSAIGPGDRPLPTLANTMMAPESQGKGRHLLEGSLPSGNSRTR
jgi:hypothetical protein